MKLRGRFALGFALAALVPIAAAAIGTRTVVQRNSEAMFESRRKVAETLAARALAELTQGVVRAVDTQAGTDTAYVGGTLFELTTYGELPAASRDRLREQGRPLMASLAFAVLFLLDSQDRVLDAPHNRAVVGEVDRSRRAAAESHVARAFFAREAVLAGDHIQKVLVCEAARTTRDGDHAVTVVGGRILDAGLLEPVENDPAVAARVVDADGAVRVASRRPLSATGPRIRLPLAGQDGVPVAWLEVAVSDAEVAVVLRQVTVLAVLLAGGAVILSVLFGLWVARRMTRDLDGLVAGAQAAARGELDHQVPLRARDEIGAVGQAMNTMMVDLKESKERLVMAERIAAWQEIARRLAHEIKNPLTPIQMSVETLRKAFVRKHPSFDEVFEESTQTVLEEAARLKRLVSEFSEFARMPTPDRRPLVLAEVIASSLALYPSDQVSFDPPPDGLPSVDADRDAIRQAVLNLVENARDAVATRPPDERRIRVAVKLARDGRALAIVVDDSGPGVPLEMRDKIFTPYFTTKHARGGTGLGLAIVHRIVSEHGGRIAVAESNLGGARFVVELPVS